MPAFLDSILHLRISHISRKKAVQKEGYFGILFLLGNMHMRGLRVMKYKVLLMGNNKMVINEFFTYMDFSFECFSLRTDMMT